MRHALIVFLTIFSLSSQSLASIKAVPAATQAIDTPMRHPPTPEKKPAKPEKPFYQKLAYDSQKNEWSFTATIIQIKDAYLIGGHGQVALVEYLTGPCRGCTTTTGHDGKLDKMWVAVSFGESKYFDGSFYLSDRKLVPGDKIRLSLSGPYVSKSGVNWYACPMDDEYCQWAGLADGNGPTAIDWDNVEINSTNELIWSGHGSSGSGSFFGGGVLCWKITVLDDSVSLDSVGKHISRNYEMPVWK